jgi:hypothetical protein
METKLQYRGLVIENDYGLPEELEGFIEARKDLFSEIRVVSHARHYPQEVSDALKEGYDAIITLSTFMYKDQLEDTVMLLDKSPIKYKFFVWGGTRHLNDFISTRMGRVDTWAFNEYDAFIEIIKKWVDEERIFNVYRAGEAKKIIYNKEHNIFYTEGELDYVLEYDLKRIHQEY